MTAVVLVDIGALLLVLTGFHMAFRQRLVRRWWNCIFGRPSGPALQLPDDADPVHYALIISGMMVMAFGLIAFTFVSTYALLG